MVAGRSLLTTSTWPPADSLSCSRVWASQHRNRWSSVATAAGGHLALWLATTSLPIGRVVALAPVCDLREAMQLGLGANATQALLGGTDPSLADPMTLLDDRPECPIAIVHGVDDDEVPVLAEPGLVARHPWVELHEVPTGHDELIEPSSGAWPMVRGLLRAAGR